MAYTAGDDIPVSIKFRVDGALADPGAWSVHVQPPNNGTKFELVFGVASELTKIAVGEYLWTHATSFTAGTDHGHWDYVVVSTGAAKGARPGMFVVDKPPVDP